MAKRNQLGSALGGHDPGESGCFERIAFWRSVFLNRSDSPRQHQHPRRSRGMTRGRRLIAGIDHFDAAFVINVRKLIHRQAILRMTLLCDEDNTSPGCFFHG